MQGVGCLGGLHLGLRRLHCQEEWRNEFRKQVFLACKEGRKGCPSQLSAFESIDLEIACVAVGPTIGVMPVAIGDKSAKVVGQHVALERQVYTRIWTCPFPNSHQRTHRELLFSTETAVHWKNSASMS